MEQRAFAGEVVERYAYDAFGRTRIFDAAGGKLRQSSQRKAKKVPDTFNFPC